MLLIKGNIGRSSVHKRPVNSMEVVSVRWMASQDKTRLRAVMHVITNVTTWPCQHHVTKSTSAADDRLQAALNATGTSLRVKRSERPRHDFLNDFNVSRSIRTSNWIRSTGGRLA